MQVNMDFGKPAVVKSQKAVWIPSPMKGVNRCLLERDGGEFTTRATTLVSYDKGSYFSEHTHRDGEEFYVVDGVFSDETGDFSQGMYVRNPPGSRHKPYSENGCTIFVKLEQFSPEDQDYVRIDTNREPWLATDQAGVREMPLFDRHDEHVKLVEIETDCSLDGHHFTGGSEILVISGQLAADHNTYPKRSWIRTPPGTNFYLTSSGLTRVYIKYGHLANI